MHELQIAIRHLRLRGSRDKWLFSFSMSVVRLDETNCEVMGVRFDMILLFILYCLVVECVYYVFIFDV